MLAASLGVDPPVVQDLRLKALWQMSAINRNRWGTRELARQYDLSKEAVREILRKASDERRLAGDYKPLEPCYDHASDRHLSFEEWTDFLIKEWDKIRLF